MKKWLFFLILPFITVVVQSTLLNHILPGRFKPDIILMITVYMGLFQPGPAGIFNTVLSGFLTDIFSASIFGTNIFLLLLVFLTSTLLSDKFYLLGIAQGMFLVFLLSAFHSFVLIFLLFASGKIPFIHEGIIMTLISQSILTALVSPVVFLFLDKAVEV